MLAVNAVEISCISVIFKISKYDCEKLEQKLKHKDALMFRTPFQFKIC